MEGVVMQDKTIEEMIEEIQKQFNIVGRIGELRKCLAAKLANRHILLEGDVGVGKTTLANAMASYFSQNLERVDGDERYSSAKLVGHFDPPMVIEQGYSWDSFVTGPLTKAMKQGAILFLNELNRMPEGTQNVLLSAMDEGIIIIPKLGKVKAQEGFFIISAMNPAELVATTPLSEALRDRFVWIRLQYQSEEEEENIVRVRTGIKDDKIIKIAVKIVRQTRDWPDLRRGASIRGALDLASIIRFLESNDIESWIDGSIMALATKIELEDGVESQIEDVVKDIVQSAFKDLDFF
ncbi:MAG: MoxR family ATPase [Candidatus Heimdallarchaeota archaeon]|nr:MoxR family ATPase [Candidatus Heimdallarchaeota archaeon]